MISVTEKAQERVRSLLKEKPEMGGLRVRVIGGGCGGLEYKLDLDKGPQEGDKIVEGEGFQVYVDNKSYLFVINSVLDWKEDLMGSSFRFENPQVKGTCGCGSSFYIE
ncbi:MAG: iron-sulfur cluster assembly accessory protein [Planctomycetota bacterium]|nr:iron-sulfur cluster assembly accessory protein [Planctomycetota bacterium]